jgi:hypothetical protein
MNTFGVRDALLADVASSEARSVLGVAADVALWIEP